MPCGSWGSNGMAGAQRMWVYVYGWMGVCASATLFKEQFSVQNGLRLYGDMLFALRHHTVCVSTCICVGGEKSMHPKLEAKNCLAWTQNNVLFAPDLYWHDRACYNYHLRTFSLVFTEPLQWKARAVPKNSWSHPAVGQRLCSFWLLDNLVFGKAGGKMCNTNSP